MTFHPVSTARARHPQRNVTSTPHNALLTTATLKKLALLMFSPVTRREIKLLSFHRQMLLANCGKKAKSRNTAKHIASNVRTARNVTNKLHQFFFVAIRAWKVRFDSDLRHRFPQCSWNGGLRTTVTVVSRKKKRERTSTCLHRECPQCRERLSQAWQGFFVQRNTKPLATYVSHREIARSSDRATSSKPVPGRCPGSSDDVVCQRAL